MSAPTNSTFWNQTAPAVPSGDQSCVIQSDNATPQDSRTIYPKRMIGDSGSGGKAGTVPPPAAGDAAAGKFLKADGTFAVPPGGVTSSQVQQDAFTYAADTGSANAYAVALSPAPTLVAGSSGSFIAAHANTGASTLAVNGGSPIAIKKNGNSTALAPGDIAANQVIDWTYDGTVIQILVPGGGDEGIRLVSAIAGMPVAGQLVMIYTALNTETFPANFASPNSYGSLSANPASTAVYTVLKNGSSVGTISISTSGVFTFATSGGAPFNLNASDRLTMLPPNPQDATLKDVGITLVGVGVSIAGAAPPIATWRGAYNGSTAYSPYDEVSYLGSSYIAIAAGTGNLPTNASFWDVLAAVGSNGTNGTNGIASVADIQNQTYVYCVDSGTANNYIVAPSTAVGSYHSGLALEVLFAHANTGASVINVSGLGNVAIKNNGTTALSGGEIPAGSVMRLVHDGTNMQLLGVGGTGGGGSSFPFTVVQESVGNSGGSNTTSYTFNFQQAVAASGNTMFLLIACDGSSTVTIPSGWTSDINKQQSSFARFILCHKATAGESSATMTVGSSSSFAVYFFEVLGTHSLDQSATGGSANTTTISMPAITPTAGSLVFAMVAAVTSSGGNPILGLALAPWNAIGSSASAAGARSLMGYISRSAATNVSTTPPVVSFPSASLFSGGGVAYATFSIL